ncbi:MAG: serine hydrolase [Acidobacteria bacterium]|nr:serine hydrolase [Acidobacteriota bacterium]
MLLIAASLLSVVSAQNLSSRVEAVIERAPGTVSLFAKNLETGRTFGVRPDERVRTASTIKLPIMAALFQEVQRGRAKWTELLTVAKDDKVSGSGILSEFTDGMRFPIQDLMHLMIVVSDNTATNVILDRITAETVNRYMDQLGLKQTRSLRKVRGDGNQLKAPSGYSEAGKLEENKRFGLGVTTPREMVLLLEMIDKGEVVSKEKSKEMIAVLKRQRYTEGIGRRLGNTPVASKSGALDALRSDVGIVYHPKGRVALAITVDDMKNIDWSADNAGHLVISELTGILLEELTR